LVSFSVFDCESKLAHIRSESQLTLLSTRSIAMRHVSYLSVLALFAATPALAQAPTMRAELAAAQDGAAEVIVDGRLWTCSGNACTSRGEDARPAIACRKLARKLGVVTRFATSQAELDAAGLATCNQDHK
jgi:hypothetical protein